jgi:succinyl-CoA synthetase beta subunit
MQLLEHIAKRRARAVGLPVPKGYIAMSGAAAAEAASKLGEMVVVKAQIPAGGRAKAGGVVISGRSEAHAIAERMLGTQMCGYHVASVLVEEYLKPASEVYLAVAVDDRRASPVFMLGLHGGVEVNSRGNEVVQVNFPIFTGLQAWHVWEAATRCGAEPNIAKAVLSPAMAIYKLFLRYRAELVEVNPLLLREGTRAVAADVRIVVPGPDDISDANMSRSRNGFDMVELDPEGKVGLLTTGAGASMLLVDLLTEAGLRPINFCDIRTGSLRGSADRLVAALRLLVRYPNLKCIAVNVFAGITDLAEFAQLLVKAVRECSPTVPVVVRVEGMGSQAARGNLRRAGLTCAETFDELEAMVSDIVGERRSRERLTC